MANSCCQEFNTECNKIVTIGYLKTFVGNNIQNSSGAVVAVNGASGDTYCPTYGELVGGSIVPKHVASGWSGDIDGIVIGGTYSNNECVKQSDLSLVFTRFKSLTASASKTSVSECGEAVTMSSTYTLTRTTKSMNGSCAVSSSSTNGNASTSAVSYTSNQTFASVSNATVTFSKNGTVSSSTRSANITAKVTFRGTSHSASAVTITQAALTGSYSNYVSAHNVTTSVVATATTATQFGCAGGTYRATANANYTTYVTYSWKDSCGTVYSDRTTDVASGTGSTALTAKSGTFPEINPCTRKQDYSSSATLSFTDGGKTGSVTFQQTCAYVPSECPCDCTAVTYSQVTPYPSVAGTGGTVTVTWNKTYTNCNNPNCTASTVNERVEIPCNSGAARTYSGSSTSYGTWRVSQASGTPGDCGICNYTCADFLGVTAYTIPANPTTDLVNLFYFDVNEKNRYKGDTPGWSFVFAYDGDDGIFNGNVHGHHDYNFTDIGNGVTRCIVSLPKSYIKVNDRTTQKTVSLSLKGYVCSNETYTYYTLPSSMTCSVGTVTITQAAAEQTCSVTDISVANSDVTLTDGSFSNKVTVTASGSGCSKKWDGYKLAQGDGGQWLPIISSHITGNSGDNYTGTTAGRYRVIATDDTDKTAEFTVTSPATGAVLNITVNAARDNDGHAYPWLMMNGAVPQEAYQGHIEGNLGTYAISITISPTVWVSDGSMYYCCGNFSGLQGIDFENIRGLQWSNLKIFNTNGIDVDNSQIYGNPPREDGGPQACNGSWH